jgi:hypothetical protein
MNTAVELKPNMGAIVDDVIARGDLSKLTPEQRVNHYNNVCRSMGLNPLTQPFQYITLNGKLQLYARRDAADQLRKINGINIEIAEHSVRDGLLTVHVRAIDKTGRRDEDFGVVSIAGLKGEIAANAFLKAVTKAKRRVTLSISGLGWLDESEVDVEPQAKAYQSFSAPADKPLPQMRAKPAAVEPPAEGDDAAEPCTLGKSDDPGDWPIWAKLLLDKIKASADVDTINEWIIRNADGLDALKQFDETKHKRLVDMIDHQIASRTEDGT